MQLLDKNQSLAVDCLRFPLIIFVVFIHTTGKYPVDIADISWSTTLTDVNIFRIFRYLIMNVVCRVAVPSFYLFSGYYFFYQIEKFNKDIYASKIHRRIFSLLLPYLLWNLIQFLISILLILKNTLQSGNFINQITIYYHKVGGLLGIFWNGQSTPSCKLNFLGFIDGRTAPIDMPLWFLRDLIILSILTPIIYWLIKKAKIYYIVVLLMITLLNLWPWIPGLSIDGLFYYSVGAYFSINRINLLQLSLKIKKMCFLLSLIMIPAIMIFNRYYDTLITLFIIPAICSSLVIMSTIINNEKIKKILLNMKSKVFFIYGIHYLPIVAIYSIFITGLYSERNALWDIVLYLSTPLFSVTICLIWYYILLKLFPTFVSALSGGLRTKKR
jgi:hypothetical protein